MKNSIQLSRGRWLVFALVVGAPAVEMTCEVARGQAVGGDFRLAGRLVGGGGDSAGGMFDLRGVVAQPVGGMDSGAGTAGSTGGPFRLIGGLLGGEVVVPPNPPTIRAVLTADKLAELSWPADALGYVLEFAAEIGPGAVWQPVSPQPEGGRFLTPCEQPARFFRLRMP